MRAGLPAPTDIPTPTGIPAEPVDIILLAYNRLDYLREMVDTLERHTRWPYRLTVVDNVSGPETRNWLRAERERFHQVVFNRRNEHLAGFQRGIERTDGTRFVLSDADVLPHPPTAEGCWLTRLVALSERHPDFGLISARLDSVSAARNARVAAANLVDGELLETPTGVWLNLIRRRALRIPYMGDGISSYAMRRSGYRVGIAADVLATHLGDQDPVRHPDYLARKQAASGLGTVYPEYPELATAGRPPLLRELALAAPVLGAMTTLGLDPADTVELSRAQWPPLHAVEPRVQAAVRGRGRAAADHAYSGPPPLRPGGARAVAVICPDGHDPELLDDALTAAGELVLLLSEAAPPEQPAGFRLIEERPGPAAAIERLCARAGTRRWRRLLSFSTLEHRREWLAVMQAACFDGPARLRLYVLRREPPLPPASERWNPAAGARPSPPAWRAPVRRARVGPLVTKAVRLLRAESHLLRTRGRS